MKIAYIDCFSGVAGDMLLAALLDAGAPLESLLAGLKTIAAIRDEWDLEVQRVTRGTGSIAAAHVKVESKYGHRPVAPPTANRDNTEHGHSLGHDHSHDHGGNHNHSHSHDHHRAQDHSHNHDHAKSASEASDASVSYDAEPVRNLTMIRDMLEGSALPSVVKERSIEVFTALGEAEAKTHGSSIDEVHFHEVGAIDSIIDTVGTVFALHLLGIEKVFCSALPMGEGTVWTAHGILPVPAPAVLRLMTGIPVCPGPKSGKGELVTPTGASLVRVLSSAFGRPPPFTPDAVGIGAGTKDFKEHPNILRVVIGEVPPPPPSSQPILVEGICSDQVTESEAWSRQKLRVLEANIDDMTGEVAGHLVEKMLAQGALDVWLTPVLMKKSRPAYTVHVLCEPGDEDALLRLMFTESTTLGIRRHSVERCSLRRQMITSFTAFGEVRVKVAWLGDQVVNSKPEYEDCRGLAAASGVPLQVVMDEARAGVQAEIQKLRS